MSLERDMELIYEVGTMRHIERTWRQFGGVNFANLAEHTLRVMWIALVIAKHENADCGKVLQMALIHDLSETRTGDVNYLTRMYAARNEEKAVTETTKDTSIEEQTLALWHEFEQRESIEAKIVKDADNLDCDFELMERSANGNNIGEVLKPVRSQVYSKLYTETARQLFQALQLSNPHSWHLGGKNRLTEGDWKPQ